MRVIIQCAASKDSKAGSFFWKGKRVKFVAQPKKIPESKSFMYCRPDDLIRFEERTWRDMLVEYNNLGSNPYGFLTAGNLYRHPTYRMLAQQYGLNRLYILSAGWGLVRASFLLPDYNITFAPVKPSERWKKRGKKDYYKDFNHLADDLKGQNTSKALFLGGKGYLPLLRTLLENVPCQTIIFYRIQPGRPSSKEPIHPFPSATFVPFPTASCTNWHYECAKALVAGNI